MCNPILTALSTDISRCLIYCVQGHSPYHLCAEWKINRWPSIHSIAATRYMSGFNELRVTDHHCWILWPLATSSPVCQSLASEEHPHTVCRLPLLGSFLSDKHNKNPSAFICRLCIEPFLAKRQKIKEQSSLLWYLGCFNILSDTLSNRWQNMSGYIHHPCIPVLPFCPLFGTVKQYVCLAGSIGCVMLFT